MKKIFVIVLFIVSFMYSSTSYADTFQQATNSDLAAYSEIGYFTTVKEWQEGTDSYKIVYANDTKVEYLVFTNDAGCAIEELVDKDGKPQIYGSSEDESIEDIDLVVVAVGGFMLILIIASVVGLFI